MGVSRLASESGWLALMMMVVTSSLHQLALRVFFAAKCLVESKIRRSMADVSCDVRRAGGLVPPLCSLEGRRVWCSEGWFLYQHCLYRAGRRQLGGSHVAKRMRA